METASQPTWAAVFPELGSESTGTASPTAACTAESAECTCPEFCERDHDNE